MPDIVHSHGAYLQDVCGISAFSRDFRSHIKTCTHGKKKLRRNGFALIVLVDLKKKIVFLSSKVNFKLEMAHA